MVDVLFPAERLVIELDGFSPHSPMEGVPGRSCATEPSGQCGIPVILEALAV